MADKISVEGISYIVERAREAVEELRGDKIRNKSEEEMQKESYEAYLDRLSMPGCPVKLSDEEVEKLIKEGRIKPLYEV
jgi:hypothetical protein